MAEHNFHQANIHQKPELSITLGTERTFDILSNLAPTTLILGNGQGATSVEAVLQGIKIEYPQERNEVFEMGGLKALKYVRGKIRSGVVSGEKVYLPNGEIYRYNSKEHRLFLMELLLLKFRQHEEAREALLKTKAYWIYHNPKKGGDSSDMCENHKTSLPEKIFIQYLLSIRDILKRMIDVGIYDD